MTRSSGSGCVTYTTSSGLPDNRVLALYEDRARTLWVGTFGGAAHREGTSWRVLNKAGGLLVDNVNVILQDRREAFWFGSYGVPAGGISILRNGQWQHFTPHSGLPHGYITSLLESSDGSLFCFRLLPQPQIRPCRRPAGHLLRTRRRRTRGCRGPLRQRQNHPAAPHRRPGNPDSGEICLHGVSSRNIPPHQRRIGFVFQSLALWPHMTVAENIAFGIPGHPRRVDELLAQVELSGYGSRYPDELSGGEAQRVALARALAPRCRILLLDEPLSHLDGPLQWRMLDLILASARDSRATLVYVSHNPEESSRVSPRILRLHAGRLLETGTTAK